MGAAQWEAMRAVLSAQRSGPPLRPRERGPQAPAASFAQQRLWLLEQLEPGRPVHTLAVAHDLSGPLEVPLLERSLAELVRRHEALRTTLRDEQGQLRQVVHPPAPLLLPLEDLSALDAQARDEAVQRRSAEVAGTVFDLERGPLLRLLLLRLAPREHRLLVAVHHAVFDGWSFEVLMRELGALYGAALAGAPSPLAEPALQYADVALWQRERLQGEALQPLRDYWLRQLAGPLPLLRLPTDRPRRPGRARRGASCALGLGPQLTQALRALSEREGVTLFTTLLAAFQLLLHRYTGQTDLVVGSPVASRSQPGMDSLVGLLVDTLPLRTRLEGARSFGELLARARDTVAGALAHQALPFELLVEALNPPRDPDHPPLFQVMFTLQNVPRSGWSLPGLQVQSSSLAPGAVAFDLTLFMQETAGELRALLAYDADLFDAQTMEALLGHLRTLLAGIVAAPASPLGQLPLLSPAELQRELCTWNDTARPYPREATLPALFEAQVERSPEAVALASDAGLLRYRELEQEANRLARRLRTLGVGPEVRVGVRLERSEALVVTLLAILKAGGAYVPLDPSLPVAYAAGLLRAAQVAVLVAEAPPPEGLCAPALAVLRLDRERARLAQESAAPLPPTGPEASAEGLAYVLFTSGSSGQPRAVAVSHRAVVRLVHGANYAQLGAQEVLLQLSPVSFDAATFELWGALLHGATLALPPAGPFSLEAAGAAILRHRVSLLFLTPALFELFVDLCPEKLAPVRQLLVGGEVLSVSHAARFLARAPGCRLTNVYGPTEGTTFSTFQPVEAAALADGAPVPIGRPITHTRATVRDAQLQPVPVGVEGEACLAGDGLARGYLGDAALTAERFVADPLAPGTRLYRTGDRVRRDRDGRLHFLGRGDAQLKLRGFRIEPAEVESALTALPGVARAAVAVHAPAQGERRLVAYLVRAEDAAPEALAPPVLRALLRARLPAYMLPADLVWLSALPLTPTGKVDRRALPAPDGAGLRAHPALPRDALEARLLGLFEELLGVRPVGLHDSLFELGGHSLLAARLVRRIEEAGLGRLPLGQLVQAPTVAQLAEALRAPQAPPPSPTLVELRRGSDGAAPLFLVPGGHGGMAELTLYARSLAGLGGPRPVYGLLARGLDGRAPPHASVEEMARDYLAALRTVQPRGPYALAGECVGGAVAFEMAQQLLAQGEQVQPLLLLGSWCPSAAALRHYTWVERPLDLARDRFALLRAAARDLGAVARRHAADWWRAQDEAQQRFEARHGARTLLHTARTWLPRLLTVGEPLPGQSAAAEQNYTRVLVRYRPRPYPGPVTLLADAQSARQGIARGWAAWTPAGLQVHTVPGTHASYLREPSEQLLSLLRTTLSLPRSAPP